MALTKSLSRKSLRNDAKRASQVTATSPVSAGGSKRLSGVTKLQISAPIELISTTNMISYTAPTLRRSISASPICSSSSSSPTSSSFTPLSSSSSISEVEIASPPMSPRVKPNPLSFHLSSSPLTPPLRSPARSNSTRSISPTMPPASKCPPPIPRRSVTHTPATSLSARVKRNQGPPPSTSSNRGRLGTSNPFGAELAKVSEIAEEFGICVADAEEEYMRMHGLRKFCADDYLREIDGLCWGIYDNEFPYLVPGWI